MAVWNRQFELPWWAPLLLFYSGYYGTFCCSLPSYSWTIFTTSTFSQAFKSPKVLFVWYWAYIYISEKGPLSVKISFKSQNSHKNHTPFLHFLPFLLSPFIPHLYFLVIPLPMYHKVNNFLEESLYVSLF